MAGARGEGAVSCRTISAAMAHVMLPRGSCVPSITPQLYHNVVNNKNDIMVTFLSTRNTRLIFSPATRLRPLNVYCI